MIYFHMFNNFCVFNYQTILVFFQIYGCQMNVNDTEIAWSILKNSGYCRTSYVDEVFNCMMYNTLVFKVI